MATPPPALDPLLFSQDLARQFFDQLARQMEQLWQPHERASRHRWPTIPLESLSDVVPAMDGDALILELQRRSVPPPWILGPPIQSGWVVDADPASPAGDRNAYALIDTTAPLRWTITSMQGPPALSPLVPDEERGRYLCESCFDVMTDHVLPAERSPTGLAMAQCGTCAGEG